MATARAEPGSGPAGGARFFCTAGRGLEPFVMQEVRARLAATQVEYVSGKVFFTTRSDLNMLKKLKSAERLFLLIKKQFPLAAASLSKGKILNEVQRLVNDDPGSWLDAISVWKNLLELVINGEELSQRVASSLKRKVGENESIIAKKLKTEEMQKIEGDHRECQLEEQTEEDTLEQRDSTASRDKFEKEDGQREAERTADTHSQKDLTFRVSCRCSGTIGNVFTAQEVGRVIGIALMKQFGWKADLRNPNLEIFVHLNNIYTVAGIPMFRVPLASRTYIRTAGLRSTVAWAMASLAEIKVGTFVLDPMCGLGTILLEAAKEWPDGYYVGADASNSQLLGAWDNLKAAGLCDKIELLKASVTELPLPSESVDIIISDIPFGKKFKLGKDIRTILQEMERVLRVGGTIVLLLSEDHHRLLTDYGGSHAPLDSRGSRTDEPGVRKCFSPVEKTDLSEKLTTLCEAAYQECSDKMLPCGSLVPVKYYEVSLGKTNAFICKYKKSSPPGP
ncbi:PREDICTED: THUMP domain-containing protein 2 isoform X2 [Chinchilla lanigera]|uniref:U6 snRNA (guanine-N(2))-methyltransferase THUMPD2 n=1 Tax=Chinchilla lanigera TaxID=34839 RepID=A0A8C2UTZ0_CHILA|nr:PREDICTED: THUMP domain-containing protein 2 isoform X2 [Chinchilla lanigera]